MIHSVLFVLRCLDSNQGMADSKSAALPLGDTAITVGMLTQRPLASKPIL